jgi:ATP-binding cassette subfamily B protein
MKLKTIHQLDSMDCGPACLQAISMFYGKNISLRHIRSMSDMTREGVSMLGLCEAAREIGLKATGVKITIDQLANDMPLPCILFWNQNHFVVCFDVTGKGDKRTFHIMDPAIGKMKCRMKDIRRHWVSGSIKGEDIGLAMQVEKTETFNKMDKKDADDDVKGLKYFLQHIIPFKFRYLHLLVGTLVVMMLGYCTPFLSQAMVDVGIKNRDINYIMIIVLIQMVIALSQMSIQFVQSWLSLHMHTLIDINLIEDYLTKLTRMPLLFFEIKTLGDLLQRVGDHERIKGFLMNNVIGIVFSISTFLIFGTILAIYNRQIFSVFMAGNTVYILWIWLFMKYRRVIDNKIFALSSHLQNNMVQFIEGMQEIKLNNLERVKLWEWKSIQAGMYRVSLQAMKIGQIQQSGTVFFLTTTNIILSYMAARLVVHGEMTLGMMMSLSFIMGQVSGPIGSFIGFAHSWQDAKISMERLNDINGQDDELKDEERQLSELPPIGDITFNDVSFSYSGVNRNFALHHITLNIPHGKVTAIVGASGSGKTTLLKMILGFYTPQRGTVLYDKIPLQSLKPMVWRSNVGSVMQDGYVFSDTIANNIALSYVDNVDKERLYEAAEKSNLLDYIYSQPLNFSTKIGVDGIGLSQGQKQRILLARVIYKNPKIIVLDEATNSLDSDNERQIVRNLHDFYEGKTVIVAAHRLSTIREADNIVVLDNGLIVEQGTHEELLKEKKWYYNLVKNQLNFNE